ncbi:MAG: hypothetical protein LKF30_05810 [Sphingobium sp.]|jgi:hypothetical protein|nr:hypothetical protein [Sphingobium sp.]MCI1271297.1 hypothetical protein [Sphingobium sp.]MCI1757480.1 hypothetical protein [Sphingobium sp.]MCI2053136.1 hypothetical protein [Sphingobium sp.]
MAKQFDYTRGNDKLAVAKSTVGAIGGGIGVRLIIDDTVVTSKEQAALGVEIAIQKIIEDTWPLA